MFLISIPGVLQTLFADHLVLFIQMLALLDVLSFSLKSFAHLLSGCSVKWFTDNQAVPLIVDSGSMKQHLHQLVVDIFHTVKENNIEIEAEWIRRSLNEKADYLSKIVDCDDWTVKDCYFYAVNS